MSRLIEMETFAKVVEEGGFTDAAKRMGISKSAVSKHISSLESRLGARLLSRTTRRVNPTEIGLAYYDRASRILNDAGDADALVASLHAQPAGLLNISAATDFGIHELSPLMAGFLGAFPDIAVNLELNDKSLDLIAEGVDVALRTGALRDSTLRARKLLNYPMRLVASPAYLEQAGLPVTLADLTEHKLLSASLRPGGDVWHFDAEDGTTRSVAVSGELAVNDGQSRLHAAEAGLGIAFLPDFLYADAITEGRLQDAMPNLYPQTQTVYAVYPEGRFTQPKVRAFIDFLVQNLAHK